MSIPFISFVCTNFLIESDRDFIKDHKPSKLLFYFVFGSLVPFVLNCSLEPFQEGMEVVDRGGPAAPRAKQVQARPRKAELVWCNEPSGPHPLSLSITAAPEMQLSFPTTDAGCCSVPLCYATFNLCSASSIFFCHFK
jgi:hypothetical protein